MLSKLGKFLINLRTAGKSFASLIKESSPKHPYKIISFEKDDQDNFIAEVQLAGRRQTLRMKPVEILADDSLIDSFSQRDIRTLTYLGYLGLNSPKYKILAQQLSENDSKLLFAIKERGNNKPIIKTANEISQDDKMIEGLQQKDAHMIGYAMASEQAQEEKKQKEKLLAAEVQSEKDINPALQKDSGN